MPRITRRWPTQCAGVSTCPYIIVAVVGIPSSCAVVITSIQAAAGSLPLVSTQRTSSSRISAAGDPLDPGRGGQLALGEPPAHVVVRDLGRGAGQRAPPGLACPDEPLTHR